MKIKLNNNNNIVRIIDTKIVASVAAAVCINQTLLGIGYGAVGNYNIFKKVESRVFRISSIDMKRDPFSPGNAKENIGGVGTGFLYHGKNYVVTNAHVVADSPIIKVDDMDASVVGMDLKHDIAVLKISGGKDMVGWGEAEPLKKCEGVPHIGDPVLALGNPLGFEKSLSSGIISGVDRVLESGIRTPLIKLLQTDASINPGNSGGPLLDAMKGCVVGVNTAIVSHNGGGTGLGFAVPINVVDDVVNDIITGNMGENTNIQLGVMFLPEIYSDGLGVKGLIVAGILPNSIGEKIGLEGTYRDVQGRPHIGDIVLEINGVKIDKVVDIYVAMEGVVKGNIVTIKVLKYDGIVDYSVQT